MMIECPNCKHIILASKAFEMIGHNAYRQDLLRVAAKGWAEVISDEARRGRFLNIRNIDEILTKRAASLIEAVGKFVEKKE